MPDYSDHGKTVIMANGQFPQDSIPLGILRHARRVIAGDGAAATLLSNGIRPDAVIGDLDSMPQDLRESLKELVTHVPEQETNDLSKAFRFCLSNGFDRNIAILGATGLREDHTLGNISLLADFSLLAPDIEMVTDDGVFRAIFKASTLNAVPGQQISIFALDHDTPIFSSGLKYPLNGLYPKRWWQATLNQAESNQFSLDFPEGKAVLLYWTHIRAAKQHP